MMPLRLAVGFLLGGELPFVLVDQDKSDTSDNDNECFNNCFS